MKKPDRQKMTFRIDAHLARQLSERARSRRVSQTEVLEAALASMLTPDQEERVEAVLTKRLDRISRQLERLEWHVELSNEAFAIFVRFWLTSNAPLTACAPCEGPTAVSHSARAGRKFRPTHLSLRFDEIGQRTGD